LAESSASDIVLGGGEAEDREGDAAGVSIDPSAAAVAMEAAKTDPALAAEAAAYFRKQSTLVDLQIKHFDEERLLGIAAARRKRYADRIRNMLATIVGGAAIGFLVALGSMVWTATHDHGLVIEAFSVPPDLAHSGLTGEVVATRFLDKLQGMQAATESERPADSYQYKWGSDIKVEIPQTGLTFSEFGKLLREKFGNVSHITGEIIRVPGGIAVTARFGDATPETFTGSEAEFDELARKSAEAVYRTSQPYRFAQFAFEHDRTAESFSVISDLAIHGPKTERGWAYTEWGNLDLNANGDLTGAQKHCLKALAYSDASAVPADICLVNEEVWSGHDEKALEYSKALAGQAQVHAPGITDDYFENNKIISAAWLEALDGDLQQSAKDWILAKEAPEYLGSIVQATTMAATVDALNHDPESAMQVMKDLSPNDDQSFLQLDAAGAFPALPAYWIAAAKGNWPAAVDDARASDSWLETHSAGGKLLARLRPVWIQPLEALAMARSGDVAGAQALVASTPLDCYLCVRIRGAVASTKHDWSSAEHWFSEAVRQGPSLPFAFSEWGEMRLAKGDVAGAAEMFATANQKSPRFADALKGWGDVLVRQRKWDAAREKYNDALIYAPNWKELKDARDAASKERD
jgi:tetratricopeptide (TPR) repeat protein